MFVKRDFDLFRVSDAANGPLVISEDFNRCIMLYNIRECPSVVSEATFLQQHYGSEIKDLYEHKQFVICEYMDIVWAYTEIVDMWAKQQYFAEKASYLKSLRDNLTLMKIYHFYEDLEPFELLDNAFDIFATLKDLGDASPIAWVKNAPVTTLHKQLRRDAVQALSKLPSRFGCMGYNFTKTPGKVCMRDSCGLSLYKTAEFDFTQDGILLTPDNIFLFDFRTLVLNAIRPITKIGDIQALAQEVVKLKGSIPVEKIEDINPAEAIYDLFCKTQESVLNPLIGNRKALRQVLNLFSTV